MSLRQKVAEFMKAYIDESCVSCGLCVELCPKVFQMGTSLAEVIVDVIPEDSIQCARESADRCPVQAIRLE